MSQTEMVVDAAAALEELLATHLGAQGNGLGEKIRSVQEVLPRHIADKLFYVNRERNAMLHPPRRPLTDEGRFAVAVAESLAWLTGDGEATPASVLARIPAGGAAAAPTMRVVRGPGYWLGRAVHYCFPTRRARVTAAVIVPLWVVGWAIFLVSKGMGSVVADALTNVLAASAILVCNYLVLRAIWPILSLVFHRPSTVFGWVAAIVCAVAACVALLALVLPHDLTAPIAHRAAEALGTYMEKAWGIVGVPLIVLLALWMFV